ncbi:hypothetical protein EJB05_06071, partial [Eragrostis curvula]
MRPVLKQGPFRLASPVQDPEGRPDSHLVAPFLHLLCCGATRAGGAAGETGHDGHDGDAAFLHPTSSLLAGRRLPGALLLLPDGVYVVRGPQSKAQAWSPCCTADQMGSCWMGAAAGDGAVDARGQSCEALGLYIIPPVRRIGEDEPPPSWDPVFKPPPAWNLVKVFLKLYNPEETQLRYVGTLFAKPSSRPSDILPDLRTLADFRADEEIELYEEVKFEPSVMLDKICIDMTFSSAEIENGDIICYQKCPKPDNEYPYPNVKFFFQHVLDQKGVKRKIQALEEEITVLKCQGRLRKEKADMECDHLKQERDNALRQVDELCALNRQVILEFSLEDLEQATEHFSNVFKEGENEYGRLFKGIIQDHGSNQAIVSVLRERRHPNTINLIGLCSEASALVYERFANGNLEDCTVSNSNPPLSWRVRAQIIGDITPVLWSTAISGHVTSSLMPTTEASSATLDIMKDPQVASDGFTYEGEAIKLWLEKGNNRSPMTNMALPNEDLIPNHALRSSIQEYLQQQRSKGQLDS